MNNHNYTVYILTNATRKVLYIGMTNDLERRVLEHYKNRGKKKTFAGRYHCYYLIHFEHYQYVAEAIAREKELKGWNRAKKEALILEENPKWSFFNVDLYGNWPVGVR